MDRKPVDDQVADAERRVRDCDWEILKCKGDILGLASRPIVYLLMCKLEQLEKAQLENRAQLDALIKQRKAADLTSS